MNINLDEAKNMINTKIFRNLIKWQNTNNITELPVENNKYSKYYGKYLKSKGPKNNEINGNIFRTLINNLNNNIISKDILYYDDKCVCILSSGLSKHILVLPRIDIYNAISLSKKHIALIKHMQYIGRKISNNALLNGYFHIHPHHSIGFLHMHMLNKNSNSEKSMDVNIIINWLSS